MTTTATTNLAAATASLEVYAAEIPAGERSRLAALAAKDATDDVACVLAEQGVDVVRSIGGPDALGWSWGEAPASAAARHGLGGVVREAYYAAYDAAGLAEARRVVDAADAAPVGPPTLATLRATLAAAERRLAAANDEVDAAQEAHEG